MSVPSLIAFNTLKTSTMFKEPCAVIAAKVNCSYKIVKYPFTFSFSSTRYVISEKYYYGVNMGIYHIISPINIYITGHIYSYLKLISGLEEGE